jgi:hypothetical protein
MLNSARYVVKYSVVIPQLILSLVKKLMQTSNNGRQVNGPEKLHINPLNTSGNLFYIRTQCVPRCKHSTPRL